jgi:8-oxo-dGTP diphosphatase
MKPGVDYVGIAVVFFCHDGKGNVLLAKRSNNCRDEQGRWDIGAGSHDDTTKMIEETLREEVRQEYCTNVLSYEFLGFRDVVRDNNGQRTHWLALDFKVLVDRSSVRIGELHKFEDLDWFTQSTLPEPVHSQLPYFLEKYGERLWSK